MCVVFLLCFMYSCFGNTRLFPRNAQRRLLTGKSSQVEKWYREKKRKPKYTTTKQFAAFLHEQTTQKTTLDSNLMSLFVHTPASPLSCYVDTCFQMQIYTYTKNYTCNHQALRIKKFPSYGY